AGARPLHVVLLAGTVSRCGPTTALSAALAAAAALSTALPTRTHRAEALAIALPVATALARRTESFDVRASASSLILLPGPHVLLGVETAVTLRHDLALVDPDLDADPAEGRLGLDEPVVDVRTNRMQRYA